jgi:putative peptide zinc metalloprotease protein
MTLVTEHPAWKKLASLRPSLPHHIQFQPRTYNDERWYLLQDKSNGRFHRINPSAYKVLLLMDGHHSLQDIFMLLGAAHHHQTDTREPDEAPTQEEIIHLLQYLYVADLLVCDMPANTQELFARQQQRRQQRWLQLLVNPLTWKIPLGSPDQLLTRLLPLARLLATRTMGVIWLLVVGYALLQAGTHWSELTKGQLDKLLTPSNLLLIWLIYPLLKVVHELGHGLFTKVWGGQVYECGLVFVVGTPLPYVDASAATAFAAKPRRLMVSAAGMAVELFLAALALLLWLQLEAGLLRDILYNIIIIGSVSTLFFNGNPLMRFDGYHLLTDLIDAPNLASRSNQQISYWVRRYAYGVQGLFSPATNLREAWLFTGYGVAAFCYRLFILATIILMAIHLTFQTTKG